MSLSRFGGDGDDVPMPVRNFKLTSASPEELGLPGPGDALPPEPQMTTVRDRAAAFGGKDKSARTPSPAPPTPTTSAVLTPLKLLAFPWFSAWAHRLGLSDLKAGGTECGLR